MPPVVAWALCFMGAFALFIVASKLLDTKLPSSPDEHQPLRSKLRHKWQTWTGRQYDQMLEGYQAKYRQTYQEETDLFDQDSSDTGDEILAELRRKQQEDDESDDWWDDFRRQEDEQAQRLLDYAIQHPGSPEAIRHLNECLEETQEELDQVRRSLSHEGVLLRFSQRYSPEERSAITRIQAYQAEMRQLEERLQLIRQALGDDPEVQ